MRQLVDASFDPGLKSKDRIAASNVLGMVGVMSVRSRANPSSFEPESSVDLRPTIPPPGPPPSGLQRKARPVSKFDPLEEALVARPHGDSREIEPAVHEILHRFSVGDEQGAVAVSTILLDGRRAPALTVSLDVLDELDLDHRAVVLLNKVDGVTSLSGVLEDCGLERADAVHTVCELIERHIVVLRALR